MRVRRSLVMLAAGCVLISAAAAVIAMNREYLPGIEWPEPPVVTPGEDGSPPSDAIVLFDGHDLSAWEPAENWKVEDGAMVVGQGDIHTQAELRRLPVAHRVVGARTRPTARARTAATAASFCRTLRAPGARLVSRTRPTSTARPARSTSRRRRWSTPCGRRASGTCTTSSGPHRDSTTTARSSRRPTSRRMQNGVVILNHFECWAIHAWHRLPNYETARQAADPSAGPRPPGAIPQHLGPRARADRRHAHAASRTTTITTPTASGPPAKATPPTTGS